MSDVPHDDESAELGPGAGDPDATREWDAAEAPAAPSGAADAAPAESPGDATQTFPGPVGNGPVGGDATQLAPTGDETSLLPGAADAADSTSVMPPVDPRWTARASVRAPDEAVDEEGGWEEPRGSMLPVLITLGVVIILALIGLGIWAILQANQPTPAPIVTTSAAPIPTTTAAPAPPTTTGPPPATATSPAAILVLIPELKGASQADATNQLTALGLHPVPGEAFSDDVPVGAVVGTTPPAGTQVPQGSQVTVLISKGPATPSPTAAPTTASPSPS
jgi:hypothetical protein